MPNLPNLITIDRKQQKVLVDGDEFPWFITEDGPTVEGADNPEEVTTVTVSIFTDEVEEIPECAECDRLDRAGVDYEVVKHGAEHVRHHVTDDLHRAMAIQPADGRVLYNPNVKISDVQRRADGAYTAILTPADGQWH